MQSDAHAFGRFEVDTRWAFLFEESRAAGGCLFSLLLLKAVFDAGHPLVYCVCVCRVLALMIATDVTDSGSYIRCCIESFTDH